mmetsp:Transcript_39339/g.80666  ORF Transcript_39339/g.80666 Transcript_39339/m.80666 type:complete len:105 (+) Transcript_39339:1968-2282(+)
MADLEETIERLSKKEGVEGYVICDYEGRVLRRLSSMAEEEAKHYAEVRTAVLFLCCFFCSSTLLNALATAVLSPFHSLLLPTIVPIFTGAGCTTSHCLGKGRGS